MDPQDLLAYIIKSFAISIPESIVFTMIGTVNLLADVVQAPGVDSFKVKLDLFGFNIDLTSIKYRSWFYKTLS